MKGDKAINPKTLIITAAISFIVFLGIIGSYHLGRSTSTVQKDSFVIGSSTENNEVFPEEETGNSSITPSPRPTTSKLSLTPTPNIRTIILTADPELDGFWQSNNVGNNSTEIKVGRGPLAVSRSFVSFEITKIPGDAKISEAKLRLYQNKAIGNPYNSGGKITADHLTYGDSLDPGDYGIAALTSNIGVLSGDKTLGWKEVEVLNTLKDDLSNGRLRSQYRLHFEIESTGGTVDGDFGLFESANNSMSTNNIPQLVVKYHQ